LHLVLRLSQIFFPQGELEKKPSRFFHAGAIAKKWDAFLFKGCNTTEDVGRKTRGQIQ
jgi:hypothetical protein